MVCTVTAGGKNPAVPIGFTTRDGLRLHAVRHISNCDDALPVLCLAGLTRNGRDFEALASALAHSRDVWLLDYRGRGGSDRDPDWRNYTPLIELIDTLDFLTAMGLDRVSVIGTSRGGIIAMLIAVVRPGVLAAAVLNDIGPVIEPGGIARIAGYVGKGEPPQSWSEAAALLKSINGTYFPNVTDDEWLILARQWFDDRNGRPAHAYDADLARGFAAYGSGKPLPALWPQLTALSQVPVLAIRGENSDLLSVKVFAEMATRHPALQKLEVAGEGHAPLLRDGPTIAAIGAFLDSVDASAI